MCHATQMSYILQFLIYKHIDIIGIALKSGYLTVFQDIPQYLAATAAIVINKDDCLCRLVNKTPYIFLGVFSMLAYPAPCLVTVNESILFQSKVLQMRNQLLQVFTALEQPVRQGSVANLHIVIQETGQFTIKRSAHLVLIESNI